MESINNIKDINLDVEFEEEINLEKEYIGKCFDVEKNITEAIEICIKMSNKRS